MQSRNLATISAHITDHNGRIIRAYPPVPARSLLKNFIKILQAQMSNLSTTIIRTNGTEFSAAAAVGNLQCSATTGTTVGIVIGSGQTPVSMIDHKLEAQLTTNVAHATMTFAAENPDSDTWRLAISRPFTNNTGALLSVKEVALYVQFYSISYPICIDRTLYAVDVAAGETLTLTYRLTATL